MAIGVVLVSPAQGPTSASTLIPTQVFTIDGGELKGSFGYALEGGELSSPGPVIKVKVGDIVKITFKDIGKIPHTWSVLDEPKTGANVLFDATIGSASEPIMPDQDGTITFKVDKAGNFYYGCIVPGHTELGMYGDFIVAQ